MTWGESIRFFMGYAVDDHSTVTDLENAFNLPGIAEEEISVSREGDTVSIDLGGAPDDVGPGSVPFTVSEDSESHDTTIDFGSPPDDVVLREQLDRIEQSVQKELKTTGEPPQ